jgi:hypothetical protein
MVDVQNTLVHMKNGAISIDGRAYKLDGDGIVRGMPEADAKQLVERPSSPWRYLTERKPVTSPLPVAPSMPPPSPPKPDLPPPPVLEKPVERGKVAAGVERIPGPGEDWPDPVATMSVGYLHKMAQAYQVKFDKKTSKAVLIKKIMAAMYD